MEGLVVEESIWNVQSIILLTATILAFLVPIVIILPPVGLQKSDALLQTHSLAGIQPKKRNLRDQLTAKHEPRDASSARLKSLHVYPVEPCRGIELSRSKVFPTGLEHDRIYMFAQLKTATQAGKEQQRWEFITPSQFPNLTAVHVDLWLPDEMKLRKQSLQFNESFLILRYPWKDGGFNGWLQTFTAKLVGGMSSQPEKEILLPVDLPPKAEIEDKGYTLEDIYVFDKAVQALNMEKELPKELGLFLGVENRLAVFRVNPEQLRDVCSPAPRNKAASFLDAYPIHLMNLNSVPELDQDGPKNKSLPGPRSVHLRPNIVLSGAPAHEEETWKQLRLKPGTSGLYNDAIFDLSSLRQTGNGDDASSGSLGMQATPLFDESLGDDRHGWVSVGMTVKV